MTPLFLAGIVPGTLLGIGLAVAWWLQVQNEEIVSPPRRSLGDLGRALVEGFWALMLPAIIVFRLRFGVFTPTEAAVVATVYSLVIAVFVYRELRATDLSELMVSLAKRTAVVMFMVAAALGASWLTTLAEVASTLVTSCSPS